MAGKREVIAVEITPPIEKPVPEEEIVIHRQCYNLFSRLWDEIRKGAAMEVSIPIVSKRTGIGAELIRKAISHHDLQGSPCF